MKPKEKDPFLGVSSRGFALRCPHCGNPRLTIGVVRDGSQAYWCHDCNRGVRVGEMPLEGFYRPSVDPLDLPPPVAVVPPVVVQSAPPEPLQTQAGGTPRAKSTRTPRKELQASALQVTALEPEPTPRPATRGRGRPPRPALEGSAPPEGHPSPAQGAEPLDAVGSDPGTVLTEPPRTRAPRSRREPQGLVPEHTPSALEAPQSLPTPTQLPRKRSRAAKPHQGVALGTEHGPAVPAEVAPAKTSARAPRRTAAVPPVPALPTPTAPGTARGGSVQGSLFDPPTLPSEPARRTNQTREPQRVTVLAPLEPLEPLEQTPRKPRTSRVSAQARAS